MNDLLRDPFTWWVIAGAFLGAISLIIVNTASKNSADKSQKELLNKLESSTNSTINKITGATNTLVKKSKEASAEITTTINLANDKLNKQLELIETATENLKNQMENQEILLQLEYSFDWEKSNLVKHGSGSDPENYTFLMIDQLYKNNYYQLRIKSRNEEESLFTTDINSFQQLDDEHHGAEFIEDLFAQAVIINESTKVTHSFRMNILLTAININFLLNEITSGDMIEFTLTKNKKKQINNPKMKEPFAYFVGPPDFSVAKVNLKIKLRNGKLFTSKVLSCELIEEASFGFRCYAEIK